MRLSCLTACCICRQGEEVSRGVARLQKEREALEQSVLDMAHKTQAMDAWLAENEAKIPDGNQHGKYTSCTYHDVKTTKFEHRVKPPAEVMTARCHVLQQLSPAYWDGVSLNACVWPKCSSHAVQCALLQISHMPTQWSDNVQASSLPDVHACSAQLILCSGRVLSHATTLLHHDLLVFIATACDKLH